MFVKIEDLDIFYLDEGRGDNVLILHGWGCDTSVIMPIFNLLKNHYRVIAIDLPCFGKSSVPNKSFDTFDFARIVYKFVKCLKLDKLVIIGHSHGGRIAMVLANENKEMFNKMILIDSAGIKPRRTIKYYYKVYKYKIIKLIYKMFIRDKKKICDFRNKYGSNDYRNANNEIVRQTLVRVINDKIEPCICNISAETLLVWGDKDRDTPLYMGKKLNRLIKNSGLVILKDAGHYSFLDRQYEFNLIIGSFLKL